MGELQRLECEIAALEHAADVLRRSERKLRARWDAEKLKERPVSYYDDFVRLRLPQKVLEVIEWAKAAVQPDSAVLGHFGLRHSAGDFTLDYMPTVGRLVVQIEVPYGKVAGEKLWGMTDDEVGAIFTSMPYPIRERWGGGICVGCVMKVPKCHPSVEAAAKRYHEDPFGHKAAAYEAFVKPKGWE